MSRLLKREVDFLNRHLPRFLKFYDEGHGIFAKIYKDHPVEYFWGLITLAKVMKIEIGGPDEFDGRSNFEETETNETVKFGTIVTTTDGT